jgi:hypothetical protein
MLCGHPDVLRGTHRLATCPATAVRTELTLHC